MNAAIVSAGNIWYPLIDTIHPTHVSMERNYKKISQRFILSTNCYSILCVQKEAERLKHARESTTTEENSRLFLAEEELAQVWF